MKAKSVRHILTVSFLTILGSLVILTGTTYSLLTSSSKNSIVISSANVSLKATVDKIEAYSPTEIDENGSIKNDNNAATNDDNTHTFKCGGSVSVDSEGNVTITKIVPGDHVDLTIGLKNESNIAISYKVSLTGLSENSPITTSLRSSDGVKLDETNTLLPTDKTKTCILKIELPGKETNQNLEIENLKLQIKAVQIGSETELN